MLRVQRSKESSLNDEESRKASCRQSNLSSVLENGRDFSYLEIEGAFLSGGKANRHRGAKTRACQKNEESSLAKAYSMCKGRDR